MAGAALALVMVTSGASAKAGCVDWMLGRKSVPTLGRSDVTLDAYLLNRSRLAEAPPDARAQLALSLAQQAVQPADRLAVLIAFADAFQTTPFELGSILEDSGRTKIKEKKSRKKPTWRIGRLATTIFLPGKPQSVRELLEQTWTLSLLLHQVKFQEARWPWSPGVSSFPLCLADAPEDCGNDANAIQKIPEVLRRVELRPPQNFVNQTIDDLSQVESQIYPLMNEFEKIDPGFKPELVDKETFKSFYASDLIWPLLVVGPAVALDLYLNQSVGDLSLFFGSIAAGKATGSYALLRGHQLNSTDRDEAIAGDIAKTYTKRFRTHLNIHYWLKNMSWAIAVYTAVVYLPQVPSIAMALPQAVEHSITAAQNTMRLRKIDWVAFQLSIDKKTVEFAAVNERRWTDQIRQLDADVKQYPKDPSLPRRRDFYNQQLQAHLTKYGDLR